MSQRITIEIKDKIATCLTESPIVCGNSDYVVDFVFDEEWNAHNVKTAIFVVNGKAMPQVFAGNECPVPVIQNTLFTWVGVFAGTIDDGTLSTSTPALVKCIPCITDGDRIPAPPPDDVYNQIMGLLNQYIEQGGGSGSGLTEEQVKEIVRETAVTQEQDPTVSDWAKQPKKPTYSYEEIKDKPALFSGDYNDLSNKPTIPSTEGLATVEQVENLGKYADEINDKLNGTNDLVDSFNQDLSDLTDKTSELEEYSIREVSLGMLEDNELSIELKDKNGNVIASAETTLPTQDLSGLATEEYVDGLVGDINTALDELHAYAQSLVGGGVEE